MKKFIAPVLLYLCLAVVVSVLITYLTGGLFKKDPEIPLHDVGQVTIVPDSLVMYSTAGGGGVSTVESTFIDSFLVARNHDNLDTDLLLAQAKNSIVKLDALTLFMQGKLSRAKYDKIEKRCTRVYDSLNIIRAYLKANPDLIKAEK